MDKPIVIFDLDNTLLDTARFKKDIFTTIERFGVSRRKALECYAHIKNDPFTFKKFVNALIPEKLERLTALTVLDTLLTSRASYNYPGAGNMLKKLSKTNKILMVTYGSKNMQTRKIHQSGLGKYFQRIYTTSQPSKSTILKRLHKVHKNRLLLVDDSEIALAQARSIGIATIKVKFAFKNQRYFSGLYERIIKFS